MDGLIHYDHVRIPNKREIQNPKLLKFFRERDEQGDFGLSEVEQCWSEDYDYLLSHGYQLRPRFHPGWSPSWRGTSVSPVACEDSIEHFNASVIDAKRLSDGKIVAVKRVRSITLEAEIACMLSSSERLQDPMNHCVPIFDHFRDSRIFSGASFIIMPLLRAFNDPHFSYVDEVVDFVRQTLEGLVYIHSQNVAHRDLSDGNIMMDGRRLYSEDGFHPSDQGLSARDLHKYAIPRTRKDVRSVNYYFVDFGLSVHFDDPTLPRLVTGSRAQEHETPELDELIPYDPFLVDVFTLGMVYKRNFLGKYANVDFLLPLCNAMTEQVPRKRPSASDAIMIFWQSLSCRRGVALRWRLRRRRETRLQTLIGDFCSGIKEVVFQTKFPLVFFFSMLREVILFPFKVLTFLLYYGPRRLTGALRRSLRGVETSENRPLLS